jgi:DNA ligase (NAD+)
LYKLQYSGIKFGKVPYDGLVICKENSRKLLNENTKDWKHYISDCLAFKFKDESKVSKVINIEWNLSKNGRLVPLAYIDPINIEGANVTKVTLNNYDWMSNREIGIGSEVEVIRANMVIPKIVKVITKSQNNNCPTNCPECNSKLELVKCSLTSDISTLDLLCVNDNCTRFEKNLYWNLLETFSPKGIAESTIDMCIKQFNIQSVKDLKNLILNKTLTKDKISKTWGKGYGTLLLKMIDNLCNEIPTVKDILLMSDIKGIGNNSSTRMFENVLPDLFIKCIKNNDVSEIEQHCSNIVGREELKKSISRINQLLEFFDYKLKGFERSEKSIYKGEVAITGKLSLTKNQMEQTLSSLGYSLTRINKNSLFLIWDGIRESEQCKQAKKLGIEILTENEFREKFNLI